MDQEPEEASALVVDLSPLRVLDIVLFQASEQQVDQWLDARVRRTLEEYGWARDLILLNPDGTPTNVDVRDNHYAIFGETHTLDEICLFCHQTRSERGGAEAWRHKEHCQVCGRRRQHFFAIDSESESYPDRRWACDKCVVWPKEKARAARLWIRARLSINRWLLYRDRAIRGDYWLRTHPFRHGMHRVEASRIRMVERVLHGELLKGKRPKKRSLRYFDLVTRLPPEHLR